MAPHMIFLGLMHISISLIICVLCIPLAKGKVPMNNVYGIRTKKALESDENWYKINEYGAKQFIVWSILLALIGFAVLVIPIKGSFLYSLLLYAPLLYIIPAVKCYIHGKKLNKIKYFINRLINWT